MSIAGLRFLLAASLLLGSTAFAQTLEPRSAIVQRGTQLGASHHEGVVEAVRQTLLTAQVAGAVKEITVQVGDSVKAGQVLLRLDARAAEQTANASAAQVRAAQAVEREAERELARQRQLLEQDYISQAAFDRAEARQKAARAEAAALRAAAEASRTQSDFYVLRAPYDGIVSAIPVSLGDMAMPGRPLLTLYDPAALRVSVRVPQAVAANAPAELSARLELAGLDAPVTPRRVQWLPSVDPATHTVELRLELPADLRNVLPGTFARARLNLAGSEDRLYIPREAVLRRAELSAIYVLDNQQHPRLRQVRLGPQQGDQVEVLTGLVAGDRVALDPIAAGQLK
jgi:RND family efflux transporter MFP subunit